MVKLCGKLRPNVVECKFYEVVGEINANSDWYYDDALRKTVMTLLHEVFGLYS